MPTNYQTQFNAYVAYKAQSARGTAASGTGANLLPLTGGKGQLTKQAIQSQQVRQDGMAVRGRHGTQKTSGQYPGELQLSNYDPLLEAVMRGTWASGVSITQATGAMSSATLSATGSVITFSAGNVITAGLRVYDVVTFTSGLAAGDLNKPLRVVGLTNTSITVAEALTTVTGPVSSYAFSVKGRKLINPAAGALVQRYFTIEEAEIDADQSELFTDCKWGKIDLSMQPNGMLTITPSWMGTGAAQGLTGAASPYYTSPALVAAATPLAAIDATLRVGSSDFVDLTAFSLSIDLGLNAPDVVGAKTSPDVFDGVMKVSGSITAMRKDLQAFTDFLAETPLALTMLAQVPGSSPIDFLSVTVPNFTLGGVDKSEIKRDGGPRTVTLNIAAELVGVDTRGGAYDQTMVKIQASN
ncbi:phage tail tube protein [Azospirillum thermophilum]|uniref:Uncharacterized protein n=1 Tax=Azospirillum thermophilum TaxID=2202148 RepID=A0A2S2CKS1_9PROT|nr:phage tail tube protein [Azospirillum thermophilum]AWK85029.1 hypothetical protein DEW08_01485 [Azospirillum thermophilum]